MFWIIMITCTCKATMTLKTKLKKHMKKGQKAQQQKPNACGMKKVQNYRNSF